MLALLFFQEKEKKAKSMRIFFFINPWKTREKKPQIEKSKINSQIDWFK